MNCEIILFKTKFAVKTEYNEKLLSFYKSIPEFQWNAGQKTWYFPLESLTKVQNYLQEEGYNVLSSAKNGSALIVLNEQTPSIKCEFNETARAQFEDVLPTAKFNKILQDWTIENKDISKLKTLLTSLKIKYTVLQPDFTQFLQYVIIKFEKQGN